LGRLQEGLEKEKMIAKRQNRRENFNFGRFKYNRNSITPHSASPYMEFTSGRISRMPKIENSFTKKETLDSTQFRPKFSIFVHNKSEINSLDKKPLFEKSIKNKSVSNNLIYRNILFVLILLLISNLVVAIPNSLTLQGKLTNNAGAAQVGTFNFSFKIYDVYTGGTALYQTDTNITTDANGIYDVILQNLSSLNFSDQYFLGITVSTDNESQPRINLTSTPYSFRANVSEDLNKENSYTVAVFNITGNLTIGESFADVLTVTTGRLNISDGSITAAGNLTLGEKITFSLGQIIDNLVSGFLRIQGSLNVTGNLTVAQDTLFVDNTSGRVGIGTTAPGQKLTVIGNINATGNITSGTGTIILDGTNNRIGIGTTSPNDALEVIGSVRISGNLNASSINVTDFILIGGNNVVTNFNLGNITNDTVSPAQVDNITIIRVVNLTTLDTLDNYVQIGDFNLGNITNDTVSPAQVDNITIIRVVNLTTLDTLDNYVQIGDFNLGNITNDTVSPAQVDNITILRVTNISNILLDTFKIGNLTGFFGDDDFNSSVLRIGNISNILLDTFKIGNLTGFFGDDNFNSSVIRIGNLSLIFDERNSSLWNISGSSIFPLDLSVNVGIANTIANATLDVSGDIKLSAANPLINLSGPTIRKSGNDVIISD